MASEAYNRAGTRISSREALGISHTAVRKRLERLRTRLRAIAGAG